MRRLTTPAIIAATITIILCTVLTAMLPCCAEPIVARGTEEIENGERRIPQGVEPVIARGTEGEESLKWEAMILSQGTSTDGFINREMEAKMLAALKAIRAKFPEARTSM